jgi:hypothetical protein
MMSDKIVEVNEARRSQWLLPSSARVVPREMIRYLLPVEPNAMWRQGDLILGRVEGKVGLVRQVQNIHDSAGLDYRETALFPGSELVAVLAPRAGTCTCIARVPTSPVGVLHLHGVGGQAGLITPGSNHRGLYSDAPTVLRVLALLGGPDGRPLNTHEFGARPSPIPRERSPRDPGLILVVGSDMDDGKTTTARRVIHSLRAFGHPVVAGKPVGVGSLGDVTSMLDAGASEVIDFSALGEPVTVGLPQERVLELFHRIFNHLRERVPADGFVVLELADGIWYRETRFILQDERVRDLVSHVVFACRGILDAEHGLELLSLWGYKSKLRAVSGRLGSSGVLRALFPECVTRRVPVFDSLDYTGSPGPIAALFTAAA